MDLNVIVRRHQIIVGVVNDLAKRHAVWSKQLLELAIVRIFIVEILDHCKDAARRLAWDETILCRVVLEGDRLRSRRQDTFIARC